MSQNAKKEPVEDLQPVLTPNSGTVLIDACPRVLGPYAHSGKRAFDLVVAGLVTLAFAPIGIVVAAAIYFNNRSAPIMFKQTRERRYTHKTEKDPRHTRLGSLLRKSSLDELPQLLNVLTGDMSLVGPRPEILSVAERHNIRSHARHMVRPGITGLWQISELRSELLHENVHVDLDYVRKVTFLEDMRILFATVGAVISSRTK